MRIGIFGGSFNPIHNGHIVLGNTMQKAMCLDEVWFMVSPHNPLKPAAGLLPEDERLKMVEIALEGRLGLKACDYEFGLPRPSYTWNTLQNLHRDFPADEFVLIIGGDNWANFHLWAHFEDILSTHEVAVFPREGSATNDQNLPQNVKIIDVPKVNVTSTMLREMVRRGEDITPFVPKKVAERIKKMSFYM